MPINFPVGTSVGQTYTFNGSTWTWNGYAWLLGSPQGPQGNTGNQGHQGFQGNTGNQGVQGPQGFQGNTGSQGVQGHQGFQGNTGNQGVQGPQGSTGTQGNQGVQGSTGPQGNQGVQGSTGSQGPQGFLGSTGFQGFQGDTGPQGFQGDTGSQGFQGDTGPQGPVGSGSSNISVVVGSDPYVISGMSSTTVGTYDLNGTLYDMYKINAKISVPGGSNVYVNYIGTVTTITGSTFIPNHTQGIVLADDPGGFNRVQSVLSSGALVYDETLTFAAPLDLMTVNYDNTTSSSDYDIFFIAGNTNNFSCDVFVDYSFYVDEGDTIVFSN
jgi:hypothetical protein